MNLSQFNEEIRSLDKDFLQSILDGSALLMVEDQSLGLGSSNGAFVIFWIEDEVFPSIEDLRSYLAEEAEDLHVNYYKHSPLSKEYFEAKLSSLMDEYGQTAFASQQGGMPEKTLISSNGDLLVLTEEDYTFKYGLYLNLEGNLSPKISALKAKTWLQSGAAYNDYIAVNVFRFSSIE
ncbi:hypothetical protein N8477_05855 [Candidatus Thioglobus sp.]|nr:hypothetical protein [Candidatus Thioglobus sp.]